MSPRPKPPERLHRFSLRLPLSTWRRLGNTAANHGHSINTQCRLFLEAALLGSPIVSDPLPEPTERLPWLDLED